MPIASHDTKIAQRLGVHSAHFRIAGNGNAVFAVPLTGPKRIRKIVFVTDDNTGVVSMSVEPLQEVGGSALCAAQDLFLPANSVVTVNESAITTTTAEMAAAFTGVAFEVTTGGAGAWGFHVEVIYSAQENAPRTAFVDSNVSGVQG